jgi:hypothetical protein
LALANLRSSRPTAAVAVAQELQRLYGKEYGIGNLVAGIQT